MVESIENAIKFGLSENFHALEENIIRIKLPRKSGILNLSDQIMYIE